MSMFRLVRPALLLITLAITSVLGVTVFVVPVSAQSGFDRPGNDYLSNVVTSGDPEDCATMCERDRKCRAWTFVYPTETQQHATCRLKDAVPKAERDSCCLSGVRGGGVVERLSRSAEPSIDRWGGDYRSFEMKGDGKSPATAEACKKACEDDKKCRAYTFARPGYVSRTAQCYLKNDIKPPQHRPGVVSGVVR